MTNLKSGILIKNQKKENKQNNEMYNLELLKADSIRVLHQKEKLMQWMNVSLENQIKFMYALNKK